MQTFDLTLARPALEQALQGQGFDLVADLAEPNLLQARRDETRTSRSLVIDAGGQLRYHLTRALTPEQSQIHQTARGRSFHVTRETGQILTISYQLTEADIADFDAFLVELASI